MNDVVLRSWPTVVIALLLLLGLGLGPALVASPHGMVGVPQVPNEEFCACSSVLEDPEGWVDVGKTGTYYACPDRSGPGTLEEKIVAITRLRQLVERLRLEITAAGGTP